MKTLFLASLFAFLVTPFARAETLRVQGIEVEAQRIEYYSGSARVHNFRLLNPTAFPFARGNLFPASDSVYLYESGTISLLISSAPEEIDWKLSGGQVLSFDCGQKRNAWNELTPRFVSFHENGEYKSGCAALKPFSFALSQGGVITAQGDIDLNADLSLSYASKIAGGKITLPSGKIQLTPGTEVAFHASGRPHFFTMAADQSFRAKQGRYGEVLFVQNQDRPSSVSLYESGMVERGIIGQALSFERWGVTIPSGSGVAFQENGEIILAILSEPVKIEAIDNSFVAGRFGWNQENGKFEAMTAAPFTFHGPAGQILDIPVGSILTLSDSLEILRIRMPGDSRPPVDRKQLKL